MAKRFKLRLSLPSFQFCRFKQRSSFPHTPLPAATNRFSPIYPKSFDISFPGVPEPPPSTPNCPLSKLHVSPPPPKIIPVDGGCRSRSRSQSQYNWEEHHKIRQSKAEKKYKKSEEEEEKKKAEALAKSVCISTSTTESFRFGTEGSDYNEETESLISYSRSFDSSYDFDYSLETISESPINGGSRKKKKKSFNVRGLQRCASKRWKGGERRKSTMTPETVSPAGMAVFGKAGNVKESMAVVKRSEDPFEDFKRSMLEMIMEKEMVDAEDLEQLLQCFLSLNSRHHHAAIVGAFAEVWEVLFCESPGSRHVSIGH